VELSPPVGLFAGSIQRKWKGERGRGRLQDVVLSEEWDQP